MIFVTGDTHGHISINRLNVKSFKEQKELTKSDYLIIAGDFGLVWDNSKQDKYLQQELSNRNFTTLFVDGNHENFDLLKEYPVVDWNGGKVQFITDSIIHLMRGQVYTIDGVKIFTFGGARSIDKDCRVEGKTWWKEEMASKEEVTTALENLKKHNYQVDYIITHTCSNRIIEQFGYKKEQEIVNDLFNLIQEIASYKHWYFGHLHRDIAIDNNHTAIYRNITRIE